MKAGNAQTLRTSDSDADARWFRFLGLEDTGSDDLRMMVSRVAAWCQALKSREQPRWLSLLGVCGVGKSHCASRVWQWLQDTGRADHETCQCLPFMVRWPVFTNDLREGRVWDVYRDMMRWPVLVLDDVGAGSDSTGFVSSKMVDLLLARDGKWTLITSNLGFSDFGKIDPRIADRMQRHGGGGWTMKNPESYATWKRRAGQ